MSQPSQASGAPAGVRVIKITHGDVSCRGEQSDRICRKYSDQMNFNEVYTRGGYRCRSGGDGEGGRVGLCVCWGAACPLICQKTVRKVNFLHCLHLPTRLPPSPSIAAFRWRD